MNERMIGIRVLITRYISDDPQPGIVECEFVNAHGTLHRVVEKTAIVTSENIHSMSNYPREGVIACSIVGRHFDSNGQEVIVVNTEEPWHVESVDGSVRFELNSDSLIEWQWGSKTKRKWNGIA